MPASVVIPPRSHGDAGLRVDDLEDGARVASDDVTQTVVLVERDVPLAVVSEPGMEPAQVSCVHVPSSAWTQLQARW